MAAAAAPISRQRMFPVRIVACIADMSASVPRLVTLEVIKRPCPTLRHRSVVAVVRIVAVVHMAIEAARSVEPWTGSNEDSPRKPVRPIVAVGRAVIGSVVKVAVWAHRGCPNVDPDGNLGWRMRRRYKSAAQQGGCEGCECKCSYVCHVSP
jgi:hypothetical protein